LYKECIIDINERDQNEMETLRPWQAFVEQIIFSIELLANN
jgi:hypothetical protein